MATIHSFEEIEAWRESRALVSAIYTITSKGGFSKDWALIDQLRRASVSIMSNIVEGFDSDSPLEFVRFLSYSRHSASEVQSDLYVARDQTYVSQAEFSELYDQAEKVRRMVTAFMRYLKTQRTRNAPTRQRANAPTNRR